MAFSKFRIYIIVQVVLIATTSLLFFWTLDQEYMLITSSSLVILWVLQLIYLIWYLQRVNRDIIKFITAIKYDDVSISFHNKQKIDKAFVNLYKELNQIIQNISEVRSDKESEHQYFQNTVKHIGIGILAFDENGKIEICNDAVLNLLKLNRLNNINDVNNTQIGLADKFKNIKPGNNKLIKLNIDSEIIQLSVKAAKFKIKSREIRLLSLQNIKTEIDQSEVDAWQKLIRVLTHEIMNSVSPIKLLSGSLIEMFEENNKIKTIEEIDNTTIKNSVLGLKTIRKRSDGLSNFVATYKSLTQLPRPTFKELDVCSMFKHMDTLLKNDLSEKGIEFKYYCETSLLIHADEKLIEQVLINLIKNSSEALSEVTNPKITLSAELLNEQVQIKISDNGPGMNPEMIDNIFIPFFTTKEKGSGIGLSLSRQIMHVHGGNISVKSEPCKGSTFILSF
ncbi:MAG TPA: ATP-binding protein [Bacteroidales bacterium]|jgi:nitrogen fixation/metabolism regulation signal transduction histidine kinase|nr:ATP-binding protein [Bacteroidales bacterium]